MKLKVQDYHPSPDLIFLHGWGVNNGVFEKLLPELEPHYAIRFIDLPGFGRNSHIDIGEFSFDEFCTLIATQIPDNSSIVGWSLGGLAAQRIALMQERNISNLVVICSSPYFMDEDTLHHRTNVNPNKYVNDKESEDWQGIKANVLESFQSQLSTDYKKTLERFLAIQALGSPTAKNDTRQIRDKVFQYEQPSVQSLKKSLTFLQTVDLRPQLSNVTSKTLRIFGSHDSLVPKNAIEKIQKLDPKAQYQIINGASHAPFISHTVAFLKVIRTFL